MTFTLPLRPNIAALQPYASARSILKGSEWIYLDANEGAFPADPDLTSLPPLNRYPDPTCDALRDALAGYYGVRRENLFVGNGSDEIIDLCVRAFVRDGRSVAAMRPSYGVYRVSADTNGVPFTPVPLDPDFGVDVEEMLRVAQGSDIVFLCSPNNPTGSVLSKKLITDIVQKFPGVLVVDEAYGEFADAAGVPSAIDLVKDGAPNLLVLRTFSKAFGAAAIRVGYGVASPHIIDVLLRVKPPYNVNALSQAAALSLWNDRPAMQKRVETILLERERLMRGVEKLGCTTFPSSANFFLTRLPGSVSHEQVYKTLRDQDKIVLRTFDGVESLKNVLRISVGTPEKNDLLLSSLSTLL